MRISLANRLAKISSLRDLNEQIKLSTQRASQLTELINSSAFSDREKSTLIINETEERYTLEILNENYKAIKNALCNKRDGFALKLPALI